MSEHSKRSTAQYLGPMLAAVLLLGGCSAVGHQPSEGVAPALPAPLPAPKPVPVAPPAPMPTAAAPANPSPEPPPTGGSPQPSSGATAPHPTNSARPPRRYQTAASTAPAPQPSEVPDDDASLPAEAIVETAEGSLAELEPAAGSAVLRDAAVAYALSDGPVSKHQAVSLRVVASFALDHAALRAYMAPGANPQAASVAAAGSETRILGVDTREVAFIRARIQCDAALLLCTEDDAVFPITQRVFDWTWSIRAAVEQTARATVGVAFEGAAVREGPYTRLATVPALAVPISVDDPVVGWLQRLTLWFTESSAALTALQGTLAALAAVAAIVGVWWARRRSRASKPAP